MSIRTSKRVMNLGKTMGMVAAVLAFGCSSADGAKGVAGGGNGGAGNAVGSGGGSGSGGSGGTIGNTDMAMLRVVHVSPDAPAVNVYIQGESKPAVENLSYGKATEYLQVPPGKYIFEIRPAGASATSDPVYASPWLESQRRDELLRGCRRRARLERLERRVPVASAGRRLQGSRLG